MICNYFVQFVYAKPITQGAPAQECVPQVEIQSDANVLKDLLDTDVAKNIHKQLSNTLLRGRPAKTPEMFLADKFKIVQHAMSSGIIETSPPFQKIFGGTYVNFEALGDTTDKRSIRVIQRWAMKSFREDWEKLAADKDMKAFYGDNPLAMMRRIPDSWCRRDVPAWKLDNDIPMLKRGRVSTDLRSKEKYFGGEVSIQEVEF